MWKVNGRRTTDDGRQVMAKAHITFVIQHLNKYQGSSARRVWRYQRSNQNPYIEEEHTTQWPKEKVQKEKQRSVLRPPPCHGWPLWNICVTNNHWYVPLVVKTSLSFPYSWLITWFVTRLTRRRPLVEQELLTLRSTWIHPQFLVRFMLLDL
jgi:hypothetical protein